MALDVRTVRSGATEGPVLVVHSAEDTQEAMAAIHRESGAIPRAIVNPHLPEHMAVFFW